MFFLCMYVCMYVCGQKLEVEWGGEWWDGVPKEIRVNRLVVLGWFVCL